MKFRLWNAFKGVNIIKNVDDKINSLEIKLLQYYLICEMIWSLVNALGGLAVRMPKETIMIYFSTFLVLVVYVLIWVLTRKDRFVMNVYFVMVLIANPVTWYFAGGSNSSANILFVRELVLFVMCARGIKQKIFILLSLISTSQVQRIVMRLPNPVFPMEPRQYQVGGAILGLSTSLLIAFLLMRQKYEYDKERASANAYEKDLERSNSLQKNFLANMSHEIRSPLGIVMGFNNLIKESDDIEQIHEYSSDITKAGSTLLTVINDILDYSKIESGKVDIIESDYSFKDLIQDIKTDISLKCEEKGLKFAVRVDEGIPDGLFGDEIRVKQCLINVLSNAVKYTEKGVVIFKVILVEQSEPDAYRIKFVVKDTGKGISEEALPNLFSAFQRLDEGMNRGIEGTGLGMAITKNLLDEMGGTISVESKLGEGSTFTIELVQRKGNIVESENDISDEVNLEGIKVLVIDDTDLNLTLVKKLLDKDGAIVNTINNGKDGLSDMAKNKYDVILLDHMMPEMNGVEVFKKVKEMGGPNIDTPIIMLTANAMAGAMKEYLDIGFDGYLSKPIPPKELKDVVLRFGTKG